MTAKYADNALHKLSRDELEMRIRVLTSHCREAMIVLAESESDEERRVTRRRLLFILNEADAGE